MSTILIVSSLKCKQLPLHYTRKTSTRRIFFMFILWPLPASSQPKDEHRRTLSTSLNCLCYNEVRHQEPCSEPRESKETTVEVMGAAGNIEQEVKASVVVLRIETISQDVQALQSVQIVEKDIKPFAEFLLKLGNDWSLTLAASLAYHLLVAMFPIVIVLLSIFGLFPGTRQFFILQIKKVFPAPLSSTDVVSTILHKLPTTSGIVWLIAILIAVFTGSRLFALIEGCFNIIYQVHARSFLRQNLMAIAMLLLFIVCIPLMIFMSSAPAFVLSLLQNTSFGKLPDDSIAFSVAGIIGSLVASTILFGAIYVVVPNQHISIRNTWRGTVVAAITLQIYLILFPLYVAT